MYGTAVTETTLQDLYKSLGVIVLIYCVLDLIENIPPYIIQFLKVMYLFLTLQVHPTLPSVFCETNSVFLRADT